MGEQGNTDISSVLTMLRSSTISESPTASNSHCTPDAAGDHQFSIGFVMAPRMFAECFNVQRFQPRSFATIEEDGGITSDSLRVYHYRQIMVERQGRRDLPVTLGDSVQLDCQHRPVLVRFASVCLSKINTYAPRATDTVLRRFMRS